MIDGLNLFKETSKHMKHHQWVYCLFALFCFLLAPTLLADEDAFDRGWFLQICQKALAETAGTSEMTFTSGYCYGYLDGLRHAGEVANQFVTRPGLWGRQLWCIPKEERLEAVVQTVIDDLKTSSSNSEDSYPAAVMKSLKRHYSCQ